MLTLVLSGISFSSMSLRGCEKRLIRTSEQHRTNSSKVVAEKIASCLHLRGQLGTELPLSSEDRPYSRLHFVGFDTPLRVDPEQIHSDVPDVDFRSKKRPLRSPSEV